MAYAPRCRLCNGVDNAVATAISPVHLDGSNIVRCRRGITEFVLVKGNLMEDTGDMVHTLLYIARMRTHNHATSRLKFFWSTSPDECLRSWNEARKEACPG